MPHKTILPRDGGAIRVSSSDIPEYRSMYITVFEKKDLSVSDYQYVFLSPDEIKQLAALLAEED